MPRQKSAKKKPRKPGFFAKLFTTLCCCISVATNNDDKSKSKDKERPKPKAQIVQSRLFKSRKEHPAGSGKGLSPIASFPGISDRRPVQTSSLPCVIGASAVKAEGCVRSASLRNLREGEKPSPEPLGPVLSSIGASFHQGSWTQISSNWAGSQCTTMALVAVALSAIQPVKAWCRKELDAILHCGDRVHGSLLASLGRLRDRNQRVGIYELVKLSPVPVEFGSGHFLIEACPDKEGIGMVFRDPEGKPPREYGMVSLPEALEAALNGTDGAVLTVGNYSTAVIRDPRGGLHLWDSHCRDQAGLFHPKGQAVLLKLITLDDLEVLTRLKLEQRNLICAEFEAMGFRLKE